MRIKIAAANWKMNTTIKEGIELAKKINEFLITYDIGKNLVILAVPYTHISEIVKIVDYKRISVAAQNCARWERGAYTGEVSAEMIRSLGAHYVIIGHSERRLYFNETNEELKLKVDLALKNVLRPILCVGERLEERNANVHFDVVRKQLTESLFHLDKEDILKVVIAYEPVWAIGTGNTATPQQAQEMHAYIRSLIAEKYDIMVANQISILYGGSCNSQNAASLFLQPDIDGGLIGGASLKINEFVEIIKTLPR